MKICSLGAEMTHADEWTDVKKLIVAFHRSANMPKKLVKSVRLNYQAFYRTAA
jgi:hypothetical protein